MAKNSAVNLEINNNADGFDIGGGATKRKITVSGADVEIVGTGSETYTYPISGDTLVGRDSTDILTNKTIDTANNTITIVGADITDLDAVVAATPAVGNNTTHRSSTGDDHGYINQDVTTTGTPTFGTTILGDGSSLATSAVPNADSDIANKKYVDDASVGGTPEGSVVRSTGETVGKVLTADGDNTSSWQPAGGSPEGTAILSTGETGGTKVLTEDGDGTSSWQLPGGVSGVLDRISLGGTNLTVTAVDWVVINFTDAICNIDDYPAGAKAHLEIVWSNLVAAATNDVRLYDQFGVAAVAGSEISSVMVSADVYEIKSTTVAFDLPSGLKSFMLQAKVSSDTMTIAKAQLVITI